MVAPGVSVTTVSSGLSNSRVLFSGCSAATPIVSGIASILLSVNPRLTHDDVQTVLEETADNLIGSEGGPGRDDSFGHGRVNLNTALESLESPRDQGPWNRVAQQRRVPRRVRRVDGTRRARDPVELPWRSESTLAARAGWRRRVPDHRAPRRGRSLDVYGALLDDVIPIIQWPAHGGDNQAFTLEPAGDGYVRIVARHSGKALDVEFASTDDGARVIQYVPHGGANQQWLLRAVAPAADAVSTLSAR